jgi:hypothetical protein
VIAVLFQRMQSSAMHEVLFARASWIWATSLIGVTIAIHAVGVVMMALVVVRVRPGWSIEAWVRGVWPRL